MKAVYQRVSHAAVSVAGEEIARISSGVLLLVGVCPEDTEEEARLLARKVAGLRVFRDEQDKMNRSVLDTGGSVLAVSQFTLCANTRHGCRPDFFGAARPEIAEPLFAYFVGCLRDAGVTSVETGRFGADMQVALLNDGPVTILLDTDDWRKGSAACK
ncbi:MAG: D-tyrosyl-tRNA(Tyr) deacylase [Clostridia bacterium]|nr:D-tyrosyl-tRNA(Tyr) deacylase [Loktanella sp.]MBQ1950265.1 D-tyrosyl-tRNA(Tyr) deacylase [Clostridia bacterium]